MMKFAIYEDPGSGKFVLIRLPDRFVHGSKLTILPTDRRFDPHEEAVAALPDLLTLEE
jgi:hypothetical protein